MNTLDILILSFQVYIILQKSSDFGKIGDMNSPYSRFDSFMTPFCSQFLISCANGQKQFFF